MGEVTCTMCEEAPATTSYGMPVCQSCRDWLVELSGELDAMEKADPALGKAAGEVADVARAFFGGVGVACGRCGGPVYMETCENQGGAAGHIDVIASECKECGLRHDVKPCPMCERAEVTGGDRDGD